MQTHPMNSKIQMAFPDLKVHIAWIDGKNHSGWKRWRATIEAMVPKSMEYASSIDILAHLHSEGMSIEELRGIIALILPPCE